MASTKLMHIRRMNVLMALILLLVIPLAAAGHGSGRFKKTVKIKSGLLDTSAIVGKLFNYSIPSDAFVGDISFYQVLEAGMDKLPEWLVWDNESFSLYGVPDENDIGPHFIAVTAVGTPFNDTHTSLAKDVFSINVRHEGHFHGKKEGDCHASTDLLVTASIILTEQLRTFKTNEKVSLMKKWSEYFRFDLRHLRLLNVDYLLTFQKREILASSSFDGVDDEKVDAKRRRNAVVMFIMGCSSEVTVAMKPLVNRIENEISDGRLISCVGSDLHVLAFQLASGKIVPRKKRRQANQVNPAEFGQTTIEIDTPPLPTRPAVTQARWPTTTTTRAYQSTTRPAPVTTRTPSTRHTTTTVAERRTPASLSTTSTTMMASKKTTAMPKATTAPITAPPTKKPGDERPRLVYSLGAIYCYKSVLCEKEISNTFQDKEDGDTSRLKLKLRQHDSSIVWFTLNATTLTLSGLPPQEGKWSFDLTAIDSSGNQVTDAFEVVVKMAPNVGAFNHEFSLKMMLDYEDFATDTLKQASFVRHLSMALLDRNASRLLITKIERGSTVVSWSNTSLPIDRCARKEINMIVKRLNGKYFQERIGAEFPLAANPGSVIFTGKCADNSSDVPAMFDVDATSKPPIASATQVAKSDKSDNLFVATILPAIIIVVLLLVAIIVACVLYKKNQKKKGSLDETKSEFVSKGVPVIFSDEVDVEKESMAATPMLLKDEKPPLAPDFAHTNGGNDDKVPFVQPSQQSTLKSTTFGKKPSGTIEETQLSNRPLLHDFDENPLYRPPPPFEPSRIDSRSPRPKHASPQQRDPPPYVPP